MKTKLQKMESELEFDIWLDYVDKGIIPQQWNKEEYQLAKIEYDLKMKKDEELNKIFDEEN